MAVRPINLPRATDLIRFGAFELDLRTRELRKDGRSTGVPEQSIKVLHMLVARPGELVLREEIRARLWPNDTVVEFDHSINVATRKLRVALGDSADSPRYIETLARRGYRWIGPAVSLEAPDLKAEPPKPSVEPDQSPLFSGVLTGKKVSHYRVLEVLGGGGMGVVYKAEDLKLGRRVALKFLPDELAQDPVALKRLEQEARAASALNHPNVCTIHEIAEYEWRPFIVMEFLEGETLREQIAAQRSRHTPLALDKQIELGIQISDALAAAHARGIVHRDIKPANVFVTLVGVAKILDFGVAKLSGRPVPDDDASRETVSPEAKTAEQTDSSLAEALDDPSLTRTGVTLGTTGYMSPEQVRGEVLDARTDLFSFGLVLYEMATGLAAFGAPTAALMRDAILHRDPASARELNPAIPEGLALVIGKALEKDRDKRYQSAAEMRGDLERLRARALPRPPTRWKALAAGGSSLLILAASITWFWWRQSVAPAEPNVKLRQLTTNSWENPVKFGGISPNGRYLAYTDPKGIHIKLVGAEDSQLVPPPEALRGEKIIWEINDNSSTWFPDSRHFLTTSHPAGEDQDAWSSLTSSVWAVDVSGGAPRKLRDGALGFAVTPDGAAIAFGTGAGRLGERQLWLMASDGTWAHKIFEVDPAKAICCVHFFSDGTRIAYVVASDSGDTLVARDLEGGLVTPLMHPQMKNIGDFAWFSDARLVYADICDRFDAPCNLWIERFDIHSGKLLDRPRRLTTGTGASLTLPSVTADGRLVAFQQSTANSTAYVGDIEPGATKVRDMRHFTLDEGDDAISDWTPNSQTAIIVRNRGDHSAVYKQALGTDVAEPVVARVSGALLENALLSPDAKWVILLVWPIPPTPAPPLGHTMPPRKEVWHVPIDGGALRQLFSMAPGSGVSCARAPATLCVVGEPTADRRQVIVSAFDPSTGERGPELLRFDRYANPNEDMGPLAFALSPDGEWLSTSATPSGPLRILSLRDAPARELPLTGVHVEAAASWTPDGQGLILTSHRPDGASLVHVDLQANIHVLCQCESGQSCFGVPSPDGRHLGINQTRVTSNIWMLENF
jgi:serine/threonine protein kinase